MRTKIILFRITFYRQNVLFFYTLTAASGFERKSGADCEQKDCRRFGNYGQFQRLGSGIYEHIQSYIFYQACIVKSRIVNFYPPPAAALLAVKPAQPIVSVWPKQAHIRLPGLVDIEYTFLIEYYPARDLTVCVETIYKIVIIVNKNSIALKLRRADKDLKIAKRTVLQIQGDIDIDNCTADGDENIYYKLSFSVIRPEIFVNAFAERKILSAEENALKYKYANSPRQWILFAVFAH